MWNIPAVLYQINVYIYSNLGNYQQNVWKVTVKCLLELNKSSDSVYHEGTKINFLV